MSNSNMPAMPTDDIDNQLSRSNESGGRFQESRGLTKLEHFAGLAMQGLMASYGQHDVTDYDEIASDSVMAAKALLAELEKGNDT